MYYTQEQIDRANQADLVSFLHGQGEQLTRAGNEYRWKRHDSLTVRGNKWYRHSQSKGGAPIDFVMEFFGKSFTEAVELLTGEKGAAPPPDRQSPASFSDFRLPPRSTDNRIARNYLTAARRIDEDVSGFFFSTGDIYEEAAHHNAVFVGRDESGIGEYDITADELLSGVGGNNATKTEQAERLILDLLADGKELASEDIVKAAAEAGISERTVQNAKRNMGGILGARRVGGQWYNFIKKKQPPEPAS